MLNLRIGRIGQLFAPGFSWCSRCKTPWLFVHGHVTQYKVGGGCFPLCEKCWGALTPIQRLPFYRELIMSWDHDEWTWTLIETAVLNGG